MSINDPIPKSAAEVASDPNKKAKTAQGVRYLFLVIAACIVGVIMIFFMFMKPEPGQKTTQVTQVEQQRNLATASAAAPAKISPQSENVTLAAENADLKVKLQQQSQTNADLSNENLGLKNQLAQNPGVAPQQPVQGTRGPRGSLTGSARLPLGDAGAFPNAPAPASPLYTAARDAIAQRTGAAPGANGAMGTTEAPTAKREIKVSYFQPASPGAADNGAGAGAAPTGQAGPTGGKKGPAIDDLTIYDSRDFVAPNSYAPAKVLVGVDSTTGVNNAQDPKPVLLRLEGPAVGVGADGKFQSTDLKGCTVNGAAYAELSSEKVYIKLQRITCPVGPNKYMTEKIEGYVSFKGKAGVRGRVVSREGDYANRAFVAGTLQGLGQAMSMNVQRTISGVSTGADGTQSVSTAPLSGSQVGQAALGSGIGNGASMLAQYYIQRAEQYQPVIEMPTGIDVEIVFIEGFRASNKGSNQ